MKYFFLVLGICFLLLTVGEFITDLPKTNNGIHTMICIVAFFIMDHIDDHFDKLNPKP